MEQEIRSICYDRDLKIEAYRFQGMLQSFPNHFHEHYVIGYIDAGKRQLSCKNKKYIIGPGDLIFLNPRDNHTCEPVDDHAYDYRCINIKTDIMNKVVSEIFGKENLPYFVQPVIYQCEQIELMKDLHIAIMEEQAHFKKEETFLFLMEQLIKNNTETLLAEADHFDADIQAVCDYLNLHYSERITLNELSELVNLNKYSLLRNFTKLLGITPYRYLETIRINEAKKLLENGVGPIEAAMSTGFSDQSHFTNYFKEFIGLTPKQYQNIFH